MHALLSGEPARDVAIAGEPLRDLAAAALLRDIAVAGAPLRVSEPARGAPDARDAVSASRWAEVAAGGDAAAFAAMLSWEGADTDAARAVGASRSAARAAPPPSWCAALGALIDACGHEAEDPALRAVARRSPFGAVFARAAERVVDDVAAKCPEAWRRLGAASKHAIRVDLLGAWTALAAPALELEFSIRRAADGGFSLWGEPTNDASSAAYEAFIADLRGGGAAALFREYAALSRALALRAETWSAATIELLDRLHADGGALDATFGARGEVASLRLALSDPHGGGRSVADLRFASGARVVYKPKPVAVERAFRAFLDWLADGDEELAFPPVRSIDRGGYGWVEHVDARPCATAREAHRFYVRAGALLAVLHALRGTDMHRGNLVAHGEWPQLVDLETLFVPDGFGDRPREDDPFAAAQRRLFDSVVRTSLLPRWQVNGGGAAFDISGLGGFNGGADRFESTAWRAVNTDAMRLASVRHGDVAGENLPRIDGVPLTPHAYAGAIADGFRRAYDRLLERRDDLLAPGGALERFRGCVVRVILRPTNLYARLLQRVTHPDFGRDGIARSIEIRALARSVAKGGDRPPFFFAVLAECEAIERGDVPAFTIETTDRDLYENGRVAVRAALDATPYDAVVAGIRALDARDRDEQLAYVRASLAAHATSEAGPARAPRAAAPPDRGDGAPPRAGEPRDRDVASPPRAAAPLDRAAAEAEAIRIAGQLRASALAIPDGVVWPSLALLPGSDVQQLEIAGAGLYAGNAGIALFLAAASRLAPGLADLALRALAPVRASFALARRPSLALADGASGAAYALAHAGALLGASDLIDDAVRIASSIDADAIAADADLDVVRGAAGALLALLAVHRITGERALLDRARSCGDHLLAARTPAPTGHRAWATIAGRHLAGFSHGAAGIAAALTRLHAIGGGPAYLDAAREAFAYESALWSGDGWPDLRPDRAGTPASWCHGSAGIGVSRVAALPFARADVAVDLERAVDASLAAAPPAVDHLCCGMMGRIDFLYAAGAALDRADITAAALARAGAVLARAREDGGWALQPARIAGATNPSLFQGLAGIGYGLLRLVGDDLPDLLSLR